MYKKINFGDIIKNAQKKINDAVEERIDKSAQKLMILEMLKQLFEIQELLFDKKLKNAAKGDHNNVTLDMLKSSMKSATDEVVNLIGFAVDASLNISTADKAKHANDVKKLLELSIKSVKDDVDMMLGMAEDVKTEVTDPKKMN